MSEIPRREALKYIGRTLLGVSAVAVGAEIGNAIRFGEPAHDINPAASRKLDVLSRDVSEHISEAPSIPPLYSRGRLYKPEVNTEAVGAILTHLAYVEGGFTEAEKVVDFVRAHGLQVGETDEKLVSGRLTLPTPERPNLHIGLHRSGLSNYLETGDEDVYRTLGHEIYHIVQFGRNGSASIPIQVMDEYGDLTMAPILAGVSYYMGRCTYNIVDDIATIKSRKDSRATSTGFNRRAFLAGAATTAVTAPLCLSVWGGFIRPFEVQAYVQAGGNLGDTEGQLWKRIPGDLKKEALHFRPLV